MKKVLKTGNRDTKLIILLFLGSFSILMARGLPNGINTQFLGNSIFENSESILISLGGADPAWYLKAALDLKDFDVENSNNWIFNLWPPGMPIYFLGLDVLTLNSGILILSLIVVNFLWSLNYAIFAKYLLNYKSKIGLVLFTIIWIFSPISEFWNSAYGLLSADAIALNISTLLTTILLISKSTETMSKKNFYIFCFIIAILISILAHTRIIWLISTLILVGLGSFYIIVKLIFSKIISGSLGGNAKNKAFLVITILYILSLLPWTIVAEKYFRNSYSWIQASNYQFSQRWTPSDYLSENGASFLVSGGANWACTLNEKLCNEIFISEVKAGNPYSGQNLSYSDFQELTFNELRQNPINFLQLKSEIALQTWLSKPGDSIGTNSGVPFGILTLSMLSASLAISLFLTDKIPGIVIILIIGHLLYFGSILVNHFETRYFLPLHAFSILQFFFILTKLRLMKQNAK